MGTGLNSINALSLAEQPGKEVPFAYRYYCEITRLISERVDYPFKAQVKLVQTKVCFRWDLDAIGNAVQGAVCVGSLICDWYCGPRAAG